MGIGIDKCLKRESEFALNSAQHEYLTCDTKPNTNTSKDDASNDNSVGAGAGRARHRAYVGLRSLGCYGKQVGKAAYAANSISYYQYTQFQDK